MIYIIQHSDTVSPGWLIDLLPDKLSDKKPAEPPSLCQSPYQILRPDRGQDFPPHSQAHLIVLGGAMNTHEEKKFPWLKQEKVFIESTLKAGFSVLGICLGGQLLAEVLGSRVYKMNKPEVGWYPLTSSKDKSSNGSGPLQSFLDKQTVFHWHSYMFDIPTNAKRLASSDRCENQAYSCDGGIGLQFHPEVNPLLVDKYLKGEDEFLASVGVTADEIRSQTKHCHSQKSILELCLKNFIA